MFDRYADAASAVLGALETGWADALNRPDETLRQVTDAAEKAGWLTSLQRERHGLSYVDRLLRPTVDITAPGAEAAARDTSSHIEAIYFSPVSEVSYDKACAVLRQAGMIDAAMPWHAFLLGAADASGAASHEAPAEGGEAPAADAHIEAGDAQLEKAAEVRP
jgi:hypothetical protein